MSWFVVILKLKMNSFYPRCNAVSQIHPGDMPIKNNGQNYYWHLMCSIFGIHKHPLKMYIHNLNSLIFSL